MSGDGGIHFHGSVGSANVNASTGTQIVGDGANVNQGSGTINVGGQSFGNAPTVERIFGEMMAAAKTEQPSFVANEEPSATPEILSQFETPSDLLKAAKDEALSDIASVEPMPIGQFEQKQATWQERFSLIAPKVLKVALATGQAWLDSYVSQSAVIAALKAAVHAINE